MATLGSRLTKPFWRVFSFARDNMVYFHGDLVLSCIILLVCLVFVLMTLFYLRFCGRGELGVRMMVFSLVKCHIE